MKHLLLLLALLAAPWARPARAADGVPARPQPFTFVTDQAGLLQPADVKRLDYGLRQYADNTGTQVVVVTVPTLGGQDVNAFARQLGTSWGVGEKGKNNGLVVVVAKQEHKLSIEPGAGLRDKITPSVIQQAISQMTPQFKQNNYGQGLREGLNYLMATANPSSAKNATAASEPATSGSVANNGSLGTAATPEATQAMSDPAGATQTPAVEAPSPGLPWGTLLLGAVVVIGGIFLLKKLFSRNSSAASNGGGSPNFYPNQPNAPQGGSPNFYPNQGPGYGAPQQSGGSGMGGILATGAAAAAGAYLGNRLGGSHDDNDSGRHFNNDNYSNNTGLGAGAAGGAAAGAAGDDYFNSRDNGGNSSPDYFSNSGDDSSSGDYFSGNDNSYDDSSGGGGFDDNNDNSGSW